MVNIIEEILKMNPAAKIVVVSGYTAEGSVDELIQAGAFDFIQKPYTIEPIARTLNRALHP